MLSAAAAGPTQTNTSHSAQTKSGSSEVFKLSENSDLISVCVYSLESYSASPAAAQLLWLNRKLHTEFTTGCKTLCGAAWKYCTHTEVFVCVYMCCCFVFSVTWCCFRRNRSILVYITLYVNMMVEVEYFILKCYVSTVSGRTCGIKWDKHIWSFNVDWICLTWILFVIYRWMSDSVCVV